jgi:hypothetical protein
VTYSQPDNPDGTRIWTRYTEEPGGGTWSGALGGQPFALRARAAPGCSDGMSDKQYPFAVELTVQGEHRRGCAEPIAETSAQGAANLVQTYAALVEAGQYRQAWSLWGDGGRASGVNADAFARSFSRYSEWHAEVGPSGRIEGAAGSLYVTVPIRVHGRLAGGGLFSAGGAVTLRRVNDVPGSTAEQRQWHIVAIDLGP